MFIVGDSAGGGLAIALALAIRDRGLSPVAGIVALSPWADLTCSGESMLQMASRDLECSREGLLDMVASYLGSALPTNPLASPVFADFTGCRLSCASQALTRFINDTLRLAKAVAMAGGSATVSIGAGMRLSDLGRSIPRSGCGYAGSWRLD